MATNVVRSDAVVRAEAQKLSPTLIIGLGGSGGDILLRIRKKFFEKFGGIEEFPIVSYLWLDTDINYKDVGAKQFAQKVDFSHTEERMITVSDTGAITGHLDQSIYRNIAAWWPMGLNVIPRLDDGAGQYRPYSRLGLFYHYNRPETSIRQAIADALGRIQSPGAIEKITNSPKLRRLNYGAEINNLGNRNVYIIGSLAGGTGSGLFIDIARIVKGIDSNATIVGFFMSSRFFPSPKPRMHANTYAACLEWDYYNDHIYKPNWSPNESMRDLQPPLFNYSYLMDTPNAAHLVLGINADDHKKVYEMIAENVFKDFSHGAFAQAKRSARVNVGQFMGKKWEYPPPPPAGHEISDEDRRIFRQSFNRHYQSFGIASISVPHDRIITACAHRLAADLVMYWKGSGAADTNVAAIEQEVRSFLPAADVQLDGDSILARLDDAGAGAEKSSAQASLLHKIIRAAEKCIEDARGRHASEWAGFLEDALKNLRDEELKKAEPGQNPGIALRCIQQNEAKIVDQGVKAIENHCNRRIDEKKLSVLSTILFANRIAEEIEKSGKTVGDRLTQAREEVARLEGEFNNRISDLRLHADRHNLDLRKRMILSYSLLRFREDAIGAGATPEEIESSPGLLLALRQVALLESAQTVCRKLVESIRGVKNEKGEFRGGIISRFQQLERSFDTVAATLREDAAYFEQKHNEDLSLVLFERGDVDGKYYPDYVTPEKIKAVSDRVRDELHLTAAAIKDTNFLKQEGAAGKIIDLCRDVFEPVRSKAHVIDVLFEKFGGAEGRDGEPVITDAMGRELVRVFNSSRYWAFGGSDQMRNFQLEEGQEELHVGLPDVPQELGAVDGERVRRRRDAIKFYLQTRVNARFRFPDIPDTSEIIFYNDLSGVPLNFYESMYELRDIYLQLRATDNSLHLESREASKFEDVLILTDPDKQRLERALTCMVLGSLYNELWVKVEQGKKIYGYTDVVRAVAAQKRIGEEREAIGYLQQRTDVTDKLLKSCQAKLDQALQSARSAEPSKQQEARETVARIAGAISARMEDLASHATSNDANKTGDWTGLPLVPKMEYVACENLDKRIHEFCTWQGAQQQILEAKAKLATFAEIRPDGRYALKPASVAAAQP